MLKQKDLSHGMRTILVDWLVEVYGNFGIILHHFSRVLHHFSRVLQLYTVPRVPHDGLYVNFK